MCHLEDTGSRCMNELHWAAMRKGSPDSVVTRLDIDVPETGVDELVVPIAKALSLRGTVAYEGAVRGRSPSTSGWLLFAGRSPAPSEETGSRSAVFRRTVSDLDHGQRTRSALVCPVGQAAGGILPAHR